MKKVVIVTSLYPKSESETVKTTSFAIKELVERVKTKYKDINIEKVIIPINLVEWRNFKINKKIHLYMNNIRIEILPIFNLPKIGKIYSFSKYKNIFENIDLAIVHLYDGALLSYYNNIPYIYVAHNSDYFKINKYNFLFKKAKNIYARSWALKKKIEKYFEVKNVVFSGIEKELIIKRDFNRKIKTFITVSLLQKIKNIDKVILALSKLPKELDWEYYIIGDGEEKENIEKLIKTLKLENKIKMLGFKKREECIKYMRKADVFLMPSIPETFGLAYLESMASGCIIVGAKEWGLDGAIINGENGYLVNPYNIEEMIQVLNDILTQDHSYMFKNSYKTINKFTKEKAVENYYNIIKENLYDK